MTVIFLMEMYFLLASDRSTLYSYHGAICCGEKGNLLKVYGESRKTFIDFFFRDIV